MKKLSQFLKVKCADCSNEQIVFSRAASQVDCLVCGTTVAKPTGGQAVIKGELVGSIDRPE